MSKICGICAEDCSDRPRVKDQKGRYFCKACVDARTNQRTAEQTVPSAGDEPFELDDGDAFQIAEEEPGARPLPIDLLDQTEPVRGCPICLKSMPKGAKICVSCGYDAVKGIQSSTLVEKAASKKKRGKRGYLCAKCGYDLEGVPEPVCPECGTRVNLSRRDRLRQEAAAEVYHNEWKKPLIWLAVGVLGMSIVYLASGVPSAILIYAALLTVQIIIGYIVLWMCSSFLGDIGTPLLNLTRLAGIYAMVDLVGFFLGFIPVLLIPFVIKLGVYVGLFCSAFDTDWQDAIIVIFLTGLAKFAIVLLVMFYMPDLLANL